MIRNDAIYTVIRWIASGDCEVKGFFEALKVLSEDEREKVYLAMERQSQNNEGGIQCSIR